MKRKGAFTIIEFLTVLAVIVLLIALAFPVVNRTKERGRMIKCQNNLRQIGIAAFAYAGDYEDKLPGEYFGPEASIYNEIDQLGEDARNMGHKIWERIDPLRKILMPYLNNEKSIRFCPSDFKFLSNSTNAYWQFSYRWNFFQNSKSLGTLKPETYLCFEQFGGHDGGINHLYADGRVDLKFTKLKTKNHASE